jgi:hypothetical protein
MRSVLVVGNAGRERFLRHQEISTPERWSGKETKGGACSGSEYR